MVKSKTKKLVGNIVSYKKSFFYIATTVLFMIAVFSAVFYRYQTIKLKTIVNTYQLKQWQPGEIIQDDRFSFSFNSVRYDTVQVPGFWELEQGKQFVIVNISFKNNSSITYQLSPITSMTILDDNANNYHVSSAVDIHNSLGGPVNPGETVRGEVGFTLPDSIHSGQFIFNPNLQDANQISVRFKL